MIRKMFAIVLALGLVCPTWAVNIVVRSGGREIQVAKHVKTLSRRSVTRGTAMAKGKKHTRHPSRSGRTQTHLTSPHRTPSSRHTGRNVPAISRITNKAQQAAMRQSMEEVSRMPLFPSDVWDVSDEAIFNQYMKGASRGKTNWFNRTSAVQDTQVYGEYLSVMQEFGEFARNLKEFQVEQSQRIAEGDLVSFEGLDTLQEQLDNVSQKIQNISQEFKMLPPDLVRKVQYLQRAQYYLTALYEGELPEQMPDPILSPSMAISNFYLTGTFKSPAETRFSRDPLNAPRGLRIAVVHGNEEVYSLVRSGAIYAQKEWTVDSFSSPEQFLAQKEYLLYDVVIGDFAPYKNDYSELLETLVDRSRGSMIILSASYAKPDLSHYYDLFDEDSNVDWINFAVNSMQYGIDGNLMLFMRKDPTGYNMYHKIVDAYRAVGGLPEWLSKDELCWNAVGREYDTWVFDLFSPRPPLTRDW